MKVSPRLLVAGVAGIFAFNMLSADVATNGVYRPWFGGPLSVSAHWGPNDIPPPSDPNNPIYSAPGEWNAVDDNDDSTYLWSGEPSLWVETGTVDQQQFYYYNVELPNWVDDLSMKLITVQLMYWASSLQEAQEYAPWLYDFAAWEQGQLIDDAYWGVHDCYVMGPDGGIDPGLLSPTTQLVDNGIYDTNPNGRYMYTKVIDMWVYPNPDHEYFQFWSHYNIPIDYIWIDTISTIPEPAAIIGLLSVGVIGIAVWRRRAAKRS